MTAAGGYFAATHEPRDAPPVDRRVASVAAWKRRAEAVETEVCALCLAARDDRTPLAAKALVGLVVAYAASPVDLIPDFLPGIGYLDDLLLLPIGVALALRLVPDEVMAECRARADDGEVDVGPARWVVGALVVLCWVGLAALALRLV